MKGGVPTTTPAIDVSSIITAITSAVTPGDIVTLLATVIGACMTFYLVWMGARIVVNMFQSAISSGRLTLGGGRRRR